MRWSNASFLLFLLFLFLLQAKKATAQAVTEIITDYGGYWQSSSSAINPVKPDNSHNLLAFTFNGNRYATGVNNTLLTSYGLAFTATDFRSLGVSGITGTISGNTKIGLGAMYDGVYNGPSSPAPPGGIATYLMDGAQGLNLGTGVANLPVGQLVFSVSNLQPGAIGDGIPDILVTQIADPSGTADSYQFTNSSDVVVGNSVNISFSSISPVGNWTVDFYEASQNPMTLSGGFTQTDRPIRLWAADFSAFGITAGNYNTVAKFKINLAGNSDVAFVAYNHTTVTLLPSTLSFFKAAVSGNDVLLSWQTVSEKDVAYFEVEGSKDGLHYATLGKVAVSTGAVRNYSFTHLQGAIQTVFYRLRQVDNNGSFSYSPVVKVKHLSSAPSLLVYPNPVKDKLLVSHAPSADGILHIWSLGGIKLQEKPITGGSGQTVIETAILSPGIYILVYTSGGEKEVKSFIKF